MKSIQSKNTNPANSNYSPFFQKENHSNFFGNGNNATAPFFSSKPLQTKLTIGQPNDKYEQEADAMADKVVQRLASNNTTETNSIQRAPISFSPTNIAQTKCSSCENEEKLHKKEKENLAGATKKLQKKPIFKSNAEPDENNIQRKCAECDKEEKLQKKSESGSLQTASSNIESSLSSSKGFGSPMPQKICGQMESSFGADFSRVRIHDDSVSVQMSKDLNAQAFTHGSDIYFSSGKYDTNSSGGKHLLAHELTHVIQQKGENTSLRRLPAIDQKDCAQYEKGEVEKSHTEKGLFDNDVFVPGFMSFIASQGNLVIADFGVDWGSVKESTQNDPLLKEWIHTFENNPYLSLEIVGYSDCVGQELQNESLRKRRATKVSHLFNKGRSRVKSYTAAPMQDYLIDNVGATNRAINRGVTLHFEEILTLPGDIIEGQVPKPSSPLPKPKIPGANADTDDCDTTQTKALNDALSLAKQMVFAAIGETDNETLMKKYFGKDAMDDSYGVKRNFMEILDALKDGPTFECEDADSWWCDGAVARTVPWLGWHIHICPSAISRGNDYLARTIIHESAHRYVRLFIPDDLCAGGWPASKSSADAETNADCYGEFAGDALTN